MRKSFQPEWRTQNRRKRRFYAKYMTWLERAGYIVVLAVVGAFIVAFNYPVDDKISASEVLVYAARTPVMATNQTMIVQSVAGEVKKGEVIAQIVEGEHISNYKLYAAHNDSSYSIEVVRANAARYPRPPIRTILAPASGHVLASKDDVIESGEEMIAILDYNDIRLDASLAGDTVARAKIGQIAKISSMDFGIKSSALFRGSSALGPIVSSEILSGSITEKINKGLQGKTIQLKDQAPLQVSEVVSVEVDANVVAEELSSLNISKEPPRNATFEAVVVSGDHVASAQIADLPPDLRAEAERAVRNTLQDAVVPGPDGKAVKVSNISNLNLLVKVKAKSLGSSGSNLKGAELKRTFDGTLRLQSPSPDLIRALKLADDVGRQVTAKVELRTGTRPIAFVLLKRS